jgi:hypothetical protein
MLTHYTDLFKTRPGPQRKGKLQRSSKLLIIFLETFRDPFVTANEAASQSMSDARAKLHKVEATEEGARRISWVHCLPGASANSDTHDTTFVSNTGNSSKAQISPKIIFLEINRVNNIITWKDDDAPALDSWTGLPRLSVGVGEDRRRRTE